ncbi:MAG: urea transporter [Deltaproteobacteria bacterium]|nr:urea transporter [Deltaproteobacteria bacterium]
MRESPYDQDDLLGLLVPTLHLRHGAAEAQLGAGLRGYAQVLFSTSPWVGGALLIASMAVPRLGLAGLAAVLFAGLIARSRGLERLDSGMLGYNPLLLGWALSVAVPGWWLWPLIAAGVPLVLAAQVGLERVMPRGLPVLSLPYVAVTWAAFLLMERVLGLPVVMALPAPLVAPLPLLDGPARALGALVFIPHWGAGLLVSLALWALRPRTGVAALALVALGLPMAVAAGVPEGIFVEVVAFNALLGGVALSEAFPRAREGALDAFLLGAALSGAMAAGMAMVLPWPVLTLPFNGVVLAALGWRALRARGA